MPESLDPSPSYGTTHMIVMYISVLSLRIQLSSSQNLIHRLQGVDVNLDYCSKSMTLDVS